MDVLSHGLWAGAAYKALNRRLAAKRLSVRAALWWGLFPDVFAFTIPIAWALWNLTFGGMSFSELPRPGEPAPGDLHPVFRLTSLLYSSGHSLPVFFVVFGVALLVARRPVWELGGWGIHILMDIPTHSYQFYPTPFLWPFSGWKFGGFSWGTPWFIILDYSALAIVYWLLREKGGKTRSGL